MFKKNTKIFTGQEISQVFADFSQSDLFSESGYKTDWIWNQYNLIQYFLIVEKNLSIEKIENILNLNESGDFPLVVKNSYEWLKEERENNPIVVSFIPMLLSALNEKNKVDNYKVNLYDYIKSFSNIFVIGIVAGLSFYFNFLNSFVITLGLFLALYWVTKKVYNKIKSKKEESNINSTIKNINKIKSTKYLELIEILSKVNYNNIPSNILDQIEVLKKKSLRISKAVNQNHIAIWLDIEKMWTQHIPLLINDFDINNESLVIKTTRAMENVLDKHLEDIIWDSNNRISAKEKYWLSKANKEIEI